MTTEQMEEAIIRIDKNVTQLVDHEVTRDSGIKEIVKEIEDHENRICKLEDYDLKDAYLKRIIFAVIVALGGFIAWFINVTRQILELLK
jgi:hypothetical protein